MSTIRFTTLLRLAVIAILAATPLSTAFAQPADGYVRIGRATRDIGSLDPAHTQTGNDEFIVRQLFNTLISPPAGTLETGLDQIEGELAERWEISDDWRVWTFYLRQGVQWHRGYGEVTADDVKFTFDRLRDPAVGSRHIAAYENVAEVNVIDDHTVEFVLETPVAFFHVNSLLPRFGPYIVPRRAVEELGEEFALNPVGSGAFEFESYQAQEYVRLRAFDDYWRGRPEIEGLTIYLMPEHSSRALAFLAGELDIAEGSNEPGWVADVTRGRPEIIADAMEPGTIVNLNLNLTRAPLDDLRVRQAMAYALNRAEFAEAYGVGAGPLYGAAPAEFYGGLQPQDIPDDLRYEHDPERARELLAEAGFPNGFTINAFISEHANYLPVMLLLQQQFARVGIDIDLRVVDHTSYGQDVRQDLNPIVVFATVQPPLASTVIHAFYHSDAVVLKPTANRNFAHYGDVVGTIDADLERALETLDPDEQRAILRDIQLQLLRDLPAIPIQTLKIVHLRHPYVDLGFTPEAGMGHFTMEYATLSR